MCVSVCALVMKGAIYIKFYPQIIPETSVVKRAYNLDKLAFSMKSPNVPIIRRGVGPGIPIDLKKLKFHVQYLQKEKLQSCVCLFSTNLSLSK